MNVLPAYCLHRNGGKRFMKNAMISSCSTKTNPSFYETFLVVSDGGITDNLLSSHFFRLYGPSFSKSLQSRCATFDALYPIYEVQRK